MNARPVSYATSELHHYPGHDPTPALSVSPLRIVEGLWGGELPPFETIDEANALIEALVQGLWNDLTRHQKRSEPFRLIRVPIEPPAANPGRYGLVRLEELDGFLEGRFNGEDAIDLPERAHQAVDQLVELRAMMAGIASLCPATPTPMTASNWKRHLSTCVN